MSEIHEEIEDFLSDNLSKNQRDEFIQRMENDTELAQLVSTYQEIDSSLEDSKLREFVVLLEDVAQDMKKEETVAAADSAPNGSVINWSRMAVAASFVLMVGVLGFLWQQSTVVTPESLFNENYEPYTYQALRTTDSRYPTELSKALTDYQRGNYIASIIQLEQWQSDETHGAVATFYLAQSYLASEKFAEAISLLEAQLAGPATVFEQPNQWYLMLAYTREDRLDEIDTISEKVLTTPGHGYEEKVRQLLDDLSN